jgi:6-pyruvoyltetrahydropterin/6-carboxytetrahydropterin synthase
MARYRMVMAKEDFKFSSAHFTLFPDNRTELLHGHNYRVRVEVTGGALGDEGLLVDIEALKRSLRSLCASLDSRTLLPAENARLAWTSEGESVEARFEERIYRFPARDVLFLPLANTTIELLAEHIWRHLAPPLQGKGLHGLAISVEESAGQLCWYEAAL